MWKPDHDSKRKRSGIYGQTTLELHIPQEKNILVKTHFQFMISALAKKFHLKITLTNLNIISTQDCTCVEMTEVYLVLDFRISSDPFEVSKNDSRASQKCPFEKTSWGSVSPMILPRSLLDFPHATSSWQLVTSS